VKSTNQKWFFEKNGKFLAMLLFKAFNIYRFYQWHQTVFVLYNTAVMAYKKTAVSHGF